MDSQPSKEEQQVGGGKPDELCMACGARWDEHESSNGPCARTKCKGFSDPYYALHEGYALCEPKPKPPDEDLYHIMFPTKAPAGSVLGLYGPHRRSHRGLADLVSMVVLH